MVFIHEGWTLYTRDVRLPDGKTITIYFFSKRVPKSGTVCDMPEGHTVGVNKRTGLPYVKKKQWKTPVQSFFRQLSNLFFEEKFLIHRALQEEEWHHNGKLVLIQAVRLCGVTFKVCDQSHTKEIPRNSLSILRDEQFPIVYFFYWR